MAESRPRWSRFAGTWYPGEKQPLVDLLDEAFAQVASVEAPAGRVIGLVCPHAGLKYSGRVAATAYRLVIGAGIDRVILIGPQHRGARGPSTSGGPDVETPLGVVKIDRELSRFLAEVEPSIGCRPEDHAAEHSLEMQYPLIQRVAPGASVLPVLMGGPSEADAERVGRAVVRVVERISGAVLIVASSDLSHYETREAAKAKDREVLDRVERLDATGLGLLLRRDPSHACGGGPILAVLEAAVTLGATKCVVTGYGDSGDVTHDTQRVVGYGAAAITT